MAKRIRASARRTSACASQKTPDPQPLPTTRCARGGRGEGSKRRPVESANGGTGEESTRKGGPVPGTPSPMRLKMSSELQAHVKRLYEETDQPVTHIALDVGVNESVIRRMGLREGWVRYVAPPRDLPPVATLLAEVEALERDRHPEVRAQRASKEDGQTNPPSFEGGLRPPPQDDGEGNAGTNEDNIERFIRVVMAHLDEFEAVRRDGKLIAKHHLETARAISMLTEAFNKLQRLRASSNGPIHDDISDMPTDLDAYRLELARQIDAFIASRTNSGDAGEPAAAPVDGA